MMKKMLVIGDGDSVFVKDFIHQYDKQGVIIDLISLGKGEKSHAVRIQKNFSFQLGFSLSAFKNFFTFRNSIIEQMDNDYDVVVIHFIYFFLAPHIFKLKNKTKKIVSVVWGSDFYRVNSGLKKFLQDIIYKNSNSIVFTNPKTKEVFAQIKKNIHTQLEVARFGLPVLDEIEQLRKYNYIELCNDFSLPNNKIKIMVGYNANLAHEQLLVIDQVSNFNENFLDKIHLIFLLGYGSSESKLLIEQALTKNKNIKYTILEKFYNFHEVAKLRLITDILINIQPTDQFSGSMQETLYAGGWVLTGAWLPYEMLMKLEPKIILMNDKNEVGKELTVLIEKNVNSSSENTEAVKEYIKRESSWENNISIWNKILFSD